MKNILLKLTFLGFFGTLVQTAAFSQSGSVSISQDNRIPELLELKSKMAANNELNDRYKIQLFYGSINEANSVQSRYRSKYGSWEPSIVYESPNYKVWVGNFRNRLEADRALLQIQKTFPNAFVMKPER
ncbi:MULTISPECIES: SPOR domain-containing protein [unclassified Leeuwenhoekiella]|uniref:SPOR domain-containing protein n=2 Tax=Leeuwenhoekiella TaxID=283735 RepID=UPI000C5BCEE7|nr:MULTISPECIES: SPOR domain-containing protein [unclassified Leeuwenhoekiella]MAW96349.1 translation initiation factor IF-2 [Leeuwenhoekiella sp.]MBA81236.1 translation initiation factor IF-2 [Leeuwenhoekiella sp.]|tara:strand:- start:329 stop:715 length:387 start_codon:yes stop_codon:yes gene_type:complete